MKMASRSATPASMKNHTIAWLPCRFSLALLAAACTTLPPPAPGPSLEAARAMLRPVPFAQLSGWTDDAVAQAWPAFLTGCATLVTPSAMTAIWRGPCSAAAEHEGEALCLQIQGSGRVQLAEGGIMRVGYADQNGQPCRSIARVLIERGALSASAASMQAIKTWAREHPEELPALLNENPSYVFFREVTPDPAALIDGPIATLGVPLAAGRAIAIDPRSIPLGAPVFLSTTWPLSNRPLSRLA